MAKKSVLDRKVELARMTRPEVELAREEANGVVVIPIGATEQHGPHLPLNTDTLPTEVTCLRAARAAGVLVAPTIHYGNSRQNMGFAGTITLRPEILIGLVKDVSLSLNKHGFDKILVVNGHGGNVEPITIALEDVHYETGAMVALVAYYGMAASPTVDGSPDFEGHAGREETEVMLALAPDDVDKDEFRLSEPITNLGEFGAMTPGQFKPFPRDMPARFIVSAWESSQFGHYGDPSMADAERGQMILDARVRGLERLLRSVKSGEITLTTRSGSMPPH